MERARHRRQRAVPRLPRRVRPRRGHAARVPRRRGRCTPATLGVAATYGRRRRACRRDRWRRRRRRAGRAAGRGRVPGEPQQRDRLRRGTGSPDCDQAQADAATPRTTSGRARSTCRPVSYAYKAAINKTWDENYGAGGAFNGPDIPFDRSRQAGHLLLRPRHALDHQRRAGPDHHRARQLPDRARLPRRLGPGLHATWLQDLDGDGTYTFDHNQLPAGATR